MSRPAGLICAIAILVALTPAAAAPQAVARKTPSGLPVPRYLSLKYGKVNARAGPGEDYRLLWVYRAKGLPLQVVAETTEWRRVCDPQGGAAWVKKSGLDGVRTAMRTRNPPLPLRARPEPAGRIEAYLRPMAVASVERCERGWCRLKVAGVRGWAPEGEIWGAAAKAQCR